MAWTLVGLFMSLSCWIWDAVVSYVLPSLSASSREKPGPLFSSFFWKSRALQLVMISSSKCLFDSAGVMAHFNTYSLHQLTKSCSNSWGLWRYAISLSRAILKFFSLKLLFEPVQDCHWHLLLFRQGPWNEVPETFFPHLEKNVGSLLSLWDLLCCKVQLQSLREELKTLGMVGCRPVYHGSVVHFARISVRLLPRGQDFSSLLCSLF